MTDGTQDPTNAEQQTSVTLASTAASAWRASKTRISNNSFTGAIVKQKKATDKSV